MGMTLVDTRVSLVLEGGALGAPALLNSPTQSPEKPCLVSSPCANLCRAAGFQGPSALPSFTLTATSTPGTFKTVSSRTDAPALRT